MIETVLIVFIIAHLKKLDIRKALKDWSIWLVIGTSIFYVYVQTNIFLDNFYFVKYTDIIQRITFLCYFIMAFKNKTLKIVSISAILIIIGKFLNYVVMNFNNGLMPVFPSLTISTGYLKKDVIGIIDNIHVLGGFDTKLIWLSDIFDFGYMVYSIGDVLVRIGAGLLLYYSIRKRSMREWKCGLISD